ncbi:tRNA glutamyl-Q(34) synthetase GluQRS [Alkanindiges hydrocarboniclasticus]|uniref:Glutamyl-Q tRNA(Asp) synthetase n=1 Tax=Alkanindiges hydrocarboniclasticus TaxID=1907941 RepID=A0A1S8CSB4_9GAMM|nr:tRNA glutamyl-Q(34) synthetase GluQRS [Alkanindiges hydrocarboniclasticus]ONG38776.1 tRNA glutamyl-Q(34) synthetase GluQRS [Alkanindiges hydrocarboniclasticus]
MHDLIPYKGRFAPSPTGPLHFGSLITALASYCEAKAQNGQWLVRIEDTDIPRIQVGATTAILTALEAFGFEWDEPVVHQQDRLEYYEQALQQLKSNHLIYACQCSRKQLSGLSANGLGGLGTYPQTCHHLNLPFDQHAIRLKTTDHTICFDDLIQGHCCENLNQTVGDFVLKRRDGIISYQLAVVVDDALQGITHVVRGADLLDNTARQIWLGQCLAVPSLHYCHIPLAMNAQGQKLSKQNLAKPLNLNQAPLLIRQALHALNQPDVEVDSPQRMLIQAVDQWDIKLIDHNMMLTQIFE